MHAGGFFRDNALMLMTMYPQVYVDLGALSCAGPRRLGWPSIVSIASIF